MKNIITSIQQLLKNAVIQSGSPLADIKRVYWWDPIDIPESSLPALTIQPWQSVYLQRGSQYDQKTHTIEIHLVYSAKAYLDSNLGAEISITNAVFSGGQIVFTSAAHGLSVGDEITLYGVNPDTFSGTYAITAKDTNTFTVSKWSTPGTYVSGGVFRESTTDKVSSVEDAIHKIEETGDDQETAAFSVCGVIQKNPNMPFLDGAGVLHYAATLAQVKTVDYSFSVSRGYPTFEVITTIEVIGIGNR